MSLGIECATLRLKWDMGLDMPAVASQDPLPSEDAKLLQNPRQLLGARGVGRVGSPFS